LSEEEHVFNSCNKAETGKNEGYKLIEDMLMSNSLIEVDFESLLGLLEEVKKGILERL